MQILTHVAKIDFTYSSFVKVIGTPGSPNLTTKWLPGSNCVTCNDEHRILPWTI